MRDLSGCELTGLVDPDNRKDAYTLICDEMNRLMKEDGLDEVFVTRKQAKKAVMCGLYGSKAVPVEVFGEELLPYFYKTLHKLCKGAMELLELLLGSWNPNEMSHQWVLPDNHYAYVPVTEAVDKRLNVNEMAKYMPTVRLQVPVSKKKGVSNIANAVHSIDAYVLRSLVRRCNYNKPVVEQFMAMSKSVIYKDTDKSLPGVERYLATKLADISVLAYIDHRTISHYPEEQIQALRAICETILEHKPFELICIHDSFGCHVNYANYLRQHYNNILAELSDSNTICDILNQLYQTDDFENTKPSISDIIRVSNYGIS